MKMGTAVTKTSVLTNTQSMDAIVDGGKGALCRQYSQSIHVIPPLDTLDSKSIMEGIAWLNNKIIHAAQYLLEKQSEHNLSGWQSSFLGKCITTKPFLVESHSFKFSTFTFYIGLQYIGCSNEASINVYDSAHTNVEVDTMAQV